MAFVQIMSYSTTRRDEMDAVLEQWLEDTRDVRRARKRLLLKERDGADRYVEVVFFDSYEDAMHNSSLPATAVMARALGELTGDGCHFVDFDVVEDGL